MKVLVMSHKKPFDEEIVTSVYSTYQKAADALEYELEWDYAEETINDLKYVTKVYDEDLYQITVRTVDGETLGCITEYYVS